MDSSNYTQPPLSGAAFLMQSPAREKECGDMQNLCDTVQSVAIHSPSLWCNGEAVEVTFFLEMLPVGGLLESRAVSGEGESLLEAITDALQSVFSGYYFHWEVTSRWISASASCNLLGLTEALKLVALRLNEALRIGRLPYVEDQVTCFEDGKYGPLVGFARRPNAWKHCS